MVMMVMKLPESSRNFESRNKRPQRSQRSNEIRAPGCLGLVIGDEILPSHVGIFFHKS